MHSEFHFWVFMYFFWLLFGILGKKMKLKDAAWHRLSTPKTNEQSQPDPQCTRSNYWFLLCPSSSVEARGNVLGVGGVRVPSLNGLSRGSQKERSGPLLPFGLQHAPCSGAVWKPLIVFHTSETRGERRPCPRWRSLCGVCGPGVKLLSAAMMSLWIAFVCASLIAGPLSHAEVTPQIRALATVCLLAASSLDLAGGLKQAKQLWWRNVMSQHAIISDRMHVDTVFL